MLEWDVWEDDPIESIAYGKINMYCIFDNSRLYYKEKEFEGNIHYNLNLIYKFKNLQYAQQCAELIEKDSQDEK